MITPGQHLDLWLVDLLLQVVVPAKPHSAGVSEYRAIGTGDIPLGPSW